MPVPSQGQTFGTPGGTRTHNKQGLNLLPLPTDAPGAYFGWEGRNRTYIVSLPKSDAIPLGDFPVVGWEGLEPPRSAQKHLIYSQAPSPIWIPTHDAIAFSAVNDLQ